MKVFLFVLLAIVGISGAYYFYSQKKPDIALNDVSILPSETLTPIPTMTPSIMPTLTGTPTAVPTQVPTAAVNIPKEIVWGNTKEKQVIFTFDAGSGLESLNTILSVLKKHNLKSTFFITGKWAETNPLQIKQISDEGHEIFNHTYSHPHLTGIADFTIIDEFNKTNQIIQSLTGKTTKPYFRPPYGERNSHVLETAAQQGYTSVYWTIDAWDWRESEGYTADQIKQRIYTNLKPGTIYLMHVGDNITGKILDEVINYITSKGYKINSLTQGL